jgi:hypothetical protein
VDINCAGCREPWDVWCVYHDAAITDGATLIGERGGMGLYESIDAQGDVWRYCAPDGLDEVAEGHVLILRCPACPPGRTALINPGLTPGEGD